MKSPSTMSYSSEISGKTDFKKLQKWLNFELPGVVLFGLSFFYNFAFTAFLIVASVFTPYLIYVLSIEKCYGWIIFFAVFVALPGVLSYYFLSSIGGMLAGAIPMALYLFYCYFLKLSLPGMLDD